MGHRGRFLKYQQPLSRCVLPGPTKNRGAGGTLAIANILPVIADVENRAGNFSWIIGIKVKHRISHWSTLFHMGGNS